MTERSQPGGQRRGRRRRLRRRPRSAWPSEIRGRAHADADAIRAPRGQRVRGGPGGDQGASAAPVGAGRRDARAPGEMRVELDALSASLAATGADGRSPPWLRCTGGCIRRGQAAVASVAAAPSPDGGSCAACAGAARRRRPYRAAAAPAAARAGRCRRRRRGRRLIALNLALSDTPVTRRLASCATRCPILSGWSTRCTPASIADADAPAWCCARPAPRDQCFATVGGRGTSPGVAELSGRAGDRPSLRSAERTDVAVVVALRVFATPVAAGVEVGLDGVEVGARAVQRPAVAHEAQHHDDQHPHGPELAARAGGEPDRGAAPRTARPSRRSPGSERLVRSDRR